MKQKRILSALGAVNETYIEEAAPAKLVAAAPSAAERVQGKVRIKTALIAAVIMALACTTAASAAYFYRVYITNRNTALPSYEITAELYEQTISPDAWKELSQMPYHAYQVNYAETAKYLAVNLLISNRLDRTVLGTGVDIQGSYAKGEQPITSITLWSRHDTGSAVSGCIEMSVYISVGTKKPYEQITQILNPELSEKDAVLSGYVSEVNGIDAKLAVYEAAGYASAYFVDRGILYGISAGGFAEEDKIDPAEYLKGLIDTFERRDIP